MNSVESNAIINTGEELCIYYGGIRLTIQWIGQSGYILKTESATVCIDPYLSNAVEELTGKKRLISPPVAAGDIHADAVVCTHNHLDHLDVKIIPNLLPTVFYAPSDCEATLRSLGADRVILFDEGAKVTVGDIELEAVYANHTIPAIGLMISHQGKRLYFSGDTYYDEKLKKLEKYQPDYAFICINGKLGNMNVEDAIRLAGELKPRVAIPNHYGMFAENTENPMLFTSRVENSFTMAIGQEYEVEECLI